MGGSWSDMLVCVLSLPGSPELLASIEHLGPEALTNSVKKESDYRWCLGRFCLAETSLDAKWIGFSWGKCQWRGEPAEEGVRGRSMEAP